MNSLILLLIKLALMSSIAIVLVLLLRRPLRRVAGSRTAWWLWLLVPTITFGSLLPRATRVLPGGPAALQQPIAKAIQILGAPDTTSSAWSWDILALGIWIGGALAMLGYVVVQHARFAGRLRPVARADGAYCSVGIDEPILMGVFAPIVLLPPDFDARYSDREQFLILAHEKAHISRFDAIANALATLFICAFWINPLVYFAWRAMRVDQELACDATVLESTAGMRRAYADTLLKAQSTANDFGLVPAGCRWNSHNPLKQRITMLAMNAPSRRRRVASQWATLVGATVAGWAAWAAQPEKAAATSGSPGGELSIVVNWEVTESPQAGVRTTARNQAPINIHVASGSEFEFVVAVLPRFYFKLNCNVGKPGHVASGSARDGDFAAKIAAMNSDNILFKCKLSDRDGVISTPSLMTLQGQPATIEVGKSQGPSLRLTLVASQALAQALANTGRLYSAKFKDVEIAIVAEAVAAATGKTIILHPKVHGLVTLITEQPITASEFYSAFGSVLAVNGYVVDESGGVVKVYPGKANY